MCSHSDVEYRDWLQGLCSFLIKHCSAFPGDFTQFCVDSGENVERYFAENSLRLIIIQKYNYSFLHLDTRQIYQTMLSYNEIKVIPQKD